MPSASRELTPIQAALAPFRSKLRYPSPIKGGRVPAQSAKKFSSSSTLLGSGVKICRRLIALTRFS